MLKEVMEVMDVLESGNVNGQQVCALFNGFNYVDTSTKKVTTEKGSTDFVRIVVKGTEGKSVGKGSSTLGVIGRLGGVGARPHRIGLVSDSDGAIAAIAVAKKLAVMSEKQDRLKGDVIITTHICPNAPLSPHEPVDFMGSPVNMSMMNEYEVDKECDAFLSIDTTKGNRIINHRGFAISPTVKKGYILRVSEDLLETMMITTGKMPITFPLSITDITPYGNGLYHLNSIMQPAVSTDAPIVGVAITTEVPVPGSASGASHEIDISECARFVVEVAKAYTCGQISFYDENEYQELVLRYGSLAFFQKLSKID